MQYWNQHKGKFVWQNASLSPGPSISRNTSGMFSVIIDVDHSMAEGVEQNKLITSYSESSATDVASTHAALSTFDDNPVDRWPISWSEQVKILVARSFKQSRGEFWTVVNLFQGVFMAFVTAAIWFQIPEKEVRRLF